MSTQTFLLLLAALLIAVSFYYGLKMMGVYRRKTASASWPMATGTVLSRDISSIRNSKTSGYSYRADVRYSYNAPGGPFEKKLFLGSKGLRAQAEKLLDSVGDTIPVRYNPDKPAEHISVYEKILPAQAIAAIGSLILAAALIVLAIL